MRKKHVVIIPANIMPKPTATEISAAYILAEFFQEDVEFVLRTSQKTPDFKIGDLYWELKSPTGMGKHNIQHTLQHASHQSSNVVFDSRFSKIRIEKIRRELVCQVTLIRNIKRLLLIEKDGKVIFVK